MQKYGRWQTLVGVVGVLGLVVTVAWAQTAAPPKAKLERLRIAVAPLGYDTNFSWLQTLSGQLDKRPALEYLVGIDRNTGAYIPELAEKWEMAPDGKTGPLRYARASNSTRTGESSLPKTCAMRSSSSPSLML